MQELRGLYGHDRHSWYSADTFNELKPPSADPGYLASISAGIYKVAAPAVSLRCIDAIAPHHTLTTACA